jgi:hypothetical protein
MRALPSAQHKQKSGIASNAWTIGPAGGLLEGAPIHFATEMARVVNDSSQMRVLPILTGGLIENVNDLLYLKESMSRSSTAPRWRSTTRSCRESGQQIVYILNLCRSELHILVRSEIHSLAEWLPVLKLVEPRLKPGAVVLGENAFEPEDLDYLRNPANG